MQLVKRCVIITVSKDNIKRRLQLYQSKQPPPIKKKGKSTISQLVKWCKIMRFENLFNTMHCDFFEIHKNEEIEKIEIVKDFYIIRAKNSNELGLMIIL